MFIPKRIKENEALIDVVTVEPQKDRLVLSAGLFLLVFHKYHDSKPYRPNPPVRRRKEPYHAILETSIICMKLLSISTPLQVFVHPSALLQGIYSSSSTEDLGI